MNTKLPSKPLVFPRIQTHAFKPIEDAAFKQSREQDIAKILRTAGLSEHVLLLDFETYFTTEYSLKKMSTIEYIKHKEFEITGLAVLDGGDWKNPTWYAGPDMADTYINCIRKKYGDQLHGVTVVGHNLRFDCGILAYHYGIHPANTVDIIDLCRHWNTRSKNDVKSLAKKFELPVQKGDTLQFKGWSTRTKFKIKKSRKKAAPPTFETLPPMTDEQMAELGEYALDDAHMEWDLFTRLLPKMSNVENELWLAHHTLELFTKPQLQVDYARGDQLVEQMEQEIDNVVAQAGYTRPEISKDTFEVLLTDALEAVDDLPARYGKPTKKKNKDFIFAIAKDDPERDLLLNHFDPTVRTLMNARVAVKSWPLHIARVKRIMRQAKANNGMLPVPLKYHGAHTGRWSGGERINLQNLGSRGHELVNAIRELLRAQLGHKLVIVDLSAIEARVLAWIAGQLDLIAAFEKIDREGGTDIYCEMATNMYGYQIIKSDHPVERSRGKVVVLGGGYGMGAAKLQDFAATMGVNLTEAECKELIADYRKSVPQITQFWTDIEAAFRYTYKSKSPCSLNGMTFHSEKDVDVVITLPNGRELKYHDVKCDKKQGWGTDQLKVWNDLEHKWVFIWGGYLTENVVQAISRDLLSEAFRRMEHAGFPVALHVHDETVSHVPFYKADEALVASNKELSTVPTWGAGLPLAAEGLITDRYGGH